MVYNYLYYWPDLCFSLCLVQEQAVLYHTIPFALIWEALPFEKGSPQSALVILVSVSFQGPASVDQYRQDLHASDVYSCSPLPGWSQPGAIHWIGPGEGSAMFVAFLATTIALNAFRQVLKMAFWALIEKIIWQWTTGRRELTRHLTLSLSICHLKALNFGSSFLNN